MIFQLHPWSSIFQFIYLFICIRRFHLETIHSLIKSESLTATEKKPIKHTKDKIRQCNLHLGTHLSVLCLKSLMLYLIILYYVRFWCTQLDVYIVFHSIMILLSYYYIVYYDITIFLLLSYIVLSDLHMTFHSILSYLVGYLFTFASSICISNEIPAYHIEELQNVLILQIKLLVFHSILMWSISWSINWGLGYGLFSLFAV